MTSSKPLSPGEMDTLLKRAPVGIFQSTPDGRYLWMNQTTARIHGYESPQEMMDSVTDIARQIFADPGTRDRLLDLLEKHGEVLDFESRQLKKDGTVIWISENIRAVRDDEGRILHYEGFITDTTEKKNIQCFLQESESKVRKKLKTILEPEGDISGLELTDIIDHQDLQALVDNLYGLVRIGMAILDLKGNVLVSTGWQDICSKFHRVHPETLNNCKESDLCQKENPAPGQFRLYRCGNGLWDMSTPIIVGGKHLGTLYSGQCFFEDEKVDREWFRARAHRFGFDEQQYLAALDRVPRLDRKTVNTIMSFYARLGLMIAELSERNIRLSRIIMERDRLIESLKESEARWHFALEGPGDGVWDWNVQTNRIFYSRQWKTTLGYRDDEVGDTYHDWESRLHPDDVQMAVNELNRHLKGETPVYKCEFRLRCRDGSYKWILDRGKVMERSPDGEPVRVIGTHTDISDRKDLENQLVQAHKMEAVGTLAGGIAHDFNNILQAIVGYSQLLISRKNAQDPDFNALEQINRSGERAAGLVNQLLAFSRKMESRHQPVNLNQVVLESERLLRSTIPKMVSMELDLEEFPRTISADPVQIEQIILNLVNNSVDAMPRGGKVEVRTRNTVLDEAFCRVHPEVTPGEYVLLLVADSGCGMDRETRNKVFEPFFTTKEVGKGTGLGLASVYGIVKNHGGNIFCRSRPGKGTEFKIFLPAINSSGPETEASVEEPAPSGGTEHILVVDDEAEIRKLTREVLEGSGYRITSAVNGEQALEVFQGRGKDIDLVILDLNMPGMGGYSCLHELKKIDPGVKVIISSGYTYSLDQSLANGAADFVAKPYRISDFLGRVRAVLDK
ncbi:PocR ligand-binding domain-containing protein [Desulfonatronovibrio hydrogenovorans]|uniref:PocR ligand-binding domain-containing protein n=1 Tax=Desulfonatronovibrio hydrogenovorans TaxID=53245 RepID=UPI00068E38BA|nr:PocR ligand-binding domain-containing protein [Desulfonatronovibrio hydrogenovorans]